MGAPACGSLSTEPLSGATGADDEPNAADPDCAGDDDDTVDDDDTGCVSGCSTAPGSTALSLLLLPLLSLRRRRTIGAGQPDSASVTFLESLR